MMMNEKWHHILSSAPFTLTSGKISWVSEKMESMSEDEKIGQLFCCELEDHDEAAFEKCIQRFHVGAIMNLPGTFRDISELNRAVQKESTIPVLIGGNLEEGADVIHEASNIADNLEIGATGNVDLAGDLGRATAKEGTQAGIRWTFAPVTDIGMNWRNPVIATRVFGSDPLFCGDASEAFIRALQMNGMAAAVKHFPGDGVDERDQHFSPTVNSLDAGTWYATYGRIYRKCIDSGAMTFMVGHILQPALAKAVNPHLKDVEILPASTSKELVQGILREKLGFNGMISTDATTMAGFDMLLPRHVAIPMAIDAGCDMLLFTKDLESDFNYVKEGLNNGILSRERLDEAVLRILALKAALGLDQYDRPELAIGTSFQPDAASAQLADICARRSITLVKDRNHILPVTPERYPRIYLMCQTEGRGFGSSQEEFSQYLKKELVKRGFSVRLHDAYDHPPVRGLGENLIKQFDLILYASNIASVSNRTVCRLDWSPSMGADAPCHIREIPTVYVSFANPYHLVDVPRIGTYINAYHFNRETVTSFLDAFTGKTVFEGKSPVDPFCGMWDSRL